MKSFWSMVGNIESDRVSGSSEIAIKTINLAIHGLNMEIDRKEVFKALKRIKERFNEMATVKNVVSVLMSKLAAADLHSPESIQEELVKLKERVIIVKKQIAEEFAGFLRSKTTILTLSRSSTVLECLREAGGRGSVASSPRFRRGLPPEPERLDGGSVAEVPAFARGFTHIGHICRFGGGSPRLSACRGISSPTAAPSPLDSPFPPFRATFIQGAIQYSS